MIFFNSAICLKHMNLMLLIFFVSAFTFLSCFPGISISLLPSTLLFSLWTAYHVLCSIFFIFPILVYLTYCAIEFLSLKKICLSPDSRWLWIWPYSEIESSQCNHIKMMSYCIRVSLNPMTNVLIRRGKFWH